MSTIFLSGCLDYLTQLAHPDSPSLLGNLLGEDFTLRTEKVYVPSCQPSLIQGTRDTKPKKGLRPKEHHDLYPQPHNICSPFPFGIPLTIYPVNHGTKLSRRDVLESLPTQSWMDDHPYLDLR
ncbi:hypothetical protein AWENTII_000204 [Aspergillus wentii]